MSAEATKSVAALATYLNDHHAGSVIAVELLEHLIENAAANERESLSALRDEILHDRSTLERLIEIAGSKPSSLRQFGGWIAEKASRLKLAVDDPDSGALARLESFEILVLGILGKRALWRALRSSDIPEFDDIDFAALENRAEAQHNQVEARRIEAARLALSQSA